ncbi:MAG: Lrp/AsnC family transcriptional regulator, regulator for asnA, asnC and gidA [Thermoplasmata archaeon]|jgi:DNA-binding Lrp family transcriptional regulator|nr:Lrp/AsnC family transcriptional regulator, regulator for asnA, asnC and gidA [Thermoplasmata archaeon]
MDDLDKALLRILKDNARESFVRMAEVLGTSEGTVRARLKKLQDDGVIKKFTIQTAGSNVKALIEIRIETNVNTASVSQQIQTWDGVERVLEVTGEHDIVVFVDVSSTSELNDIVERIRQFKEVQSTRSRLILREY